MRSVLMRSVTCAMRMLIDLPRLRVQCGSWPH
jgi:hypothetical protein